jgi:hypothetical protein
MQKTFLKKIVAIIGLFCLLFLVIISSNSCYYDKEELLYPQTTCDSATVTYSGTIIPILLSNCNGCHSGSTPSAGINFSAYAGVKSQVDNGQFLGSVSHANGYSPMPKNAAKLNNCNIAKIRKWVAAGAPNN